MAEKSKGKANAAPRLLDRAAILDAEDMPHRDVRVPEWGGLVRVRSITTAERDSFEQVTFDRALATPPQPRRPRARLVVLCAIDADGNPLFTEADEVRLEKKGGKAMDRVFAAAQALNFITVQDIEDLEKN